MQAVKLPLAPGPKSPGAHCAQTPTLISEMPESNTATSIRGCVPISKLLSYSERELTASSGPETAPPPSSSDAVDSKTNDQKLGNKNESELLTPPNVISTVNLPPSLRPLDRKHDSSNSQPAPVTESTTPSSPPKTQEEVEQILCEVKLNAMHVQQKLLDPVSGTEAMKLLGALIHRLDEHTPNLSSSPIKNQLKTSSSSLPVTSPPVTNSQLAAIAPQEERLPLASPMVTGPVMPPAIQMYHEAPAYPPQLSQPPPTIPAAVLPSSAIAPQQSFHSLATQPQPSLTCPYYPVQYATPSMVSWQHPNAKWYVQEQYNPPHSQYMLTPMPPMRNGLLITNMQPTAPPIAPPTAPPTNPNYGMQIIPNSPILMDTARRNRKRSFHQSSVTCQQCGTSQTPEWRRGPNGQRTLCNACGLFHAKVAKKQGQEEAIRLLRERRPHHEGARGM